ncbi:helix-turn-helix domain-containing protein [Nocardiopsis suaedae]|uniref:Helix-turn-helix transcriptional regulator n=1 Tax=Nocardiopsis suaedae TaxID=3018444 RepID=A0ABT4TM55_9ACTN|nr:helix-turn-helix transcriptional regulator [Nocardiopsis suaedae]MDA2805182.1 helix-turn-helix transcriptional regulator [Nocardiopsis suaedae]
MIAVAKQRRDPEEEAMGNGGPVRRRHLLRELKRLRGAVGLSQDEVSSQMGWDRGKIHRLEGGRLQRIKASDVIALCRLYQVTEEETENLAEIARESRQKSWWYRYKNVFAGPFIGLEAEASAIYEYSASIVPGLLQTEDYMVALMESSAGLISTQDEKSKRVEARLERQRSLMERTDPARLWMIIDEAALRRQVGGTDVMRRQIAHLVDVNQRPNIDLQVLPFDAGAHAAAGFQFSILVFSETDSIVYIEADQDGLYLEEEEQIARYRLVFDRLQASAISVERTNGLLASLTS